MSGPDGQAGLRLGAVTALALVAFAANSLLARAALGSGEDALAFTIIRVASGAGLLLLLIELRERLFRGRGTHAGALADPDWRMVAGLTVYLLFFSYAYLSLATGTGAIILFASVQITMFAGALARGERFAPAAWAGLAIAFAGLGWLVSPGLAAPDPLGAALMAVAGAGWGVYSLLGAGARDPLAATRTNFVWSALVIGAVGLPVAFLGERPVIGPEGALLALLSGTVASALGYSLWYAALPGLGAGRAASLQLTVPAIAAAAGVALLGEDLTLRLVLGGAAILGGVIVALRSRLA